MDEPAELPLGKPDVDQAVERMRTHGHASIEGIVDAALIADAREVFLRKYSRFLSGGDHPDSLTVGNRRYMVTLQIEPPFSDDQLLANPRLMPVLQALLGEDCVLAGYGVVVSLPGAAAQVSHRDGRSLFPETSLDNLLPVSAITVAIPLREMNDTNGTTALWPKSHRSCGQVATGPGQEFVVREGDALLWDFRLVHAGTPNRSDLPRPLLYASFCRPWFFDSENFEKQPPFTIDKSVLATLSPQARKLLVRA